MLCFQPTLNGVYLPRKFASPRSGWRCSNPPLRPDPVITRSGMKVYPVFRSWEQWSLAVCVSLCLLHSCIVNLKIGWSIPFLTPVDKHPGLINTNGDLISEWGLWREFPFRCHTLSRITWFSSPERRGGAPKFRLQKRLKLEHFFSVGIRKTHFLFWDTFSQILCSRTGRKWRNFVFPSSLLEKPFFLLWRSE